VFVEPIPEKVVESISRADRENDIYGPTIGFVLMAEGRQGPRRRDIVGPHAVSKEKRESLEGALKTGGARAVAEAAVAAVAGTNPVTAALYLAYQVAKFAYPIAKAGVETMSDTGDSDQAVHAMQVETVKQVGKAAVGASVGAIANAAVDGAAKSAGATVTQPAKAFVSTAVSEAMGELVQ